jgi:hypothetical protein
MPLNQELLRRYKEAFSNKQIIMKPRAMGMSTLLLLQSDIHVGDSAHNNFWFHLLNDDEDWVRVAKANEEL